MLDLTSLIEEIEAIANTQNNDPAVEEIRRKAPVAFRDPNVIEGAAEGKTAARLRIIADENYPCGSIRVDGSDDSIVSFTWDELDLFRTGGHLGEVDITAWMDMSTKERYEQVLRRTRPELSPVKYVISTNPMVIVEYWETAETTRRAWVDFGIGASTVTPLVEIPEWAAALHEGSFPQWENVWGAIVHDAGVEIEVEKEEYNQESRTVEGLEGSQLNVQVTLRSDDADPVGTVTRALSIVAGFSTEDRKGIEEALKKAGFSVGRFDPRSYERPIVELIDTKQG